MNGFQEMDPWYGVEMLDLFEIKFLYFLFIFFIYIILLFLNVLSVMHLIDNIRYSKRLHMRLVFSIFRILFQHLISSCVYHYNYYAQLIIFY